MSITPTIDNGYFITYVREGIRMRRRNKTMKDAEETLRMMAYDTIVDLPRVKYIFNTDKIFIIRKPFHTAKKYKEPYQM